MKSDMIDAPAEVPPTTAPRSWARCSASPSGVPGMSWESRSWLPPLMKTPVASSTAATASGSWASSRDAGLTTSHPRRAEAVNTSVYDADHLVLERRGRGDEHEPRSPPPGQLDELAQQRRLARPGPRPPPMTKSVGVVEG